MGVIVNTVNNIPTMAKHLTPKSKAASNLDFGSKQCPIISEFRNIAEGIVQGDSKQMITNLALVGAYFIIGGESGNLQGKIKLGQTSII